MHIWWKVLFFVAATCLPYSALSAQDVARYVVTSSQSINGRTCPRLTCGVARTYTPGEVLLVEAVIEGEVVSGSNLWLQMNEDGSDVFVHSSLAVASPEEEAREETETRETVNTSRWVQHRAHTALVMAPRNWLTQEQILADEELIDVLAEYYDMEPEELIEAIEEEIANSTDDLILNEPFDGTWMYVWHEPLDGSDMSLNFHKRAMMSDLEAAGAAIVSDEIVEIPAGEAARIHARYYENENDREPLYEGVIYMVIDGQNLFYISTLTLSYLFEEVEPIIDTIAQEFGAGKANT